MNVFDLFATLQLDDSNYTEGLGKAKSAAASFGGAMASTFATAAKVTIGATTALTGAMVAGAASTASYGDDIDKMSQKMGISAEAYQEWDFILQHSGTTIDTMKASMKTLVKQAESNSEAFQQLGISSEELQNLSQEELFARVVEGLQGMEEGADRTALATELLGRGGMELGALLNTTAEETEAMRQQVHELGGVMSNDGVKAAAAFQDSMQNMKTVFGGLKNNLMSNFLPSMSKVMDGITAVFSGDKGGVAQITEGIKGIVENIREALPQFVEAGGEIIGALLEAIAENLPELVEAALSIMESLIQGIIDNLPMIAESAVNIIVKLVNTLAENLPMIIEAGIQLITTLCNSLAQQAPTLVPVILDALKTIVMTLINNAPQLLEAALTLILALAQGLIDYLPQLIDDLPTIIEAIVTALVGMSGQILEAGIELLVALAGGLIKAIPELVKKLPEIIAAMVSGLMNGLGDFGQVGADLIKGLWNGISDAEEWVIEKIKGFGGKILKGIKSFFGIHSPSTVMAEIGDYMAQGLAEGWDNTVDDVVDRMNSDMDLEGNVTMVPNTDELDEGVDITATAGGLAGVGDIIIPVYIGQTRLDEVLVRAEQLRNYRSGGR